MTTRTACISIIAAWTLLLMANEAVAQLAPLCVENSPERRGELGCSVVVRKELPEGLEEPVYWHIDRFDSIERARAAAGPASFAFEADGTAWLMAVESTTADHHGGQHVTAVGPLPLPKASRYAMQINSAKFTPGMYSRPHTHSGVEAFYVLAGEQCVQTPAGATILRKGETLALPADTPMRAVATGTGIRYGFALIIHDASQPSTMQMDEATAPKLAPCGEAHFKDARLDGFGTNGRSCASCHVPEDAFQLSPQAVERRYAALLAARVLDPHADDPLFRPIDADDFRTNGAAASGYSNLLRGLIRVSLPLPPNLRLIDPRTGLPSTETVADVWRAVPSIFNVAITGVHGYQRDGRIDTLQNQALAALRTHAGARHVPDARWLDELAAFESAQFSSAGVERLAQAIREGHTAFPDPDPPLSELESEGKAIFKRSCSACHGSAKHPSTASVTSPPLKLRYHTILSACPRPKQAWCSKHGCFTLPRCDPALERNVRTYELTLANGAKERITTSDPGRLLLSGDVKDAESFDHSHGAFDIPQLRGIARTAPYFHNHSAATLEDVLTFYQAFFARREVLAPTSAFINAPFRPFSPQEKPALLAYLRKL
jgi:cytochrome c peroxidase